MACEDSCLRGNLVLSLMLWKCSGPERGLSRCGPDALGAELCTRPLDASSLQAGPQVGQTWTGDVAKTL